MNSTHAEDWKKAIHTEIEALLQNSTFDLQDKLMPFGTKPISTKWVFKVKILPDNTTKFKARLVVRGFEAVEGED